MKFEDDPSGPPLGAVKPDVDYKINWEPYRGGGRMTFREWLNEQVADFKSAYPGSEGFGMYRAFLKTAEEFDRRFTRGFDKLYAGGQRWIPWAEKVDREQGDE